MKKHLERRAILRGVPCRGVLVFLFVCCLASVPARAQDIRILMPPSAGTGDAVLATASALQANNFVFSWKGKTLTVPAVESPKGFYAQVLLPVPLDEKASRLTLRVSVRGMSSVQQDLRLVQKKYPVQELKVERAYVEPPPEVQARIAEETRRTREILGRFSLRRQWQLPMQRPVPGEVSSAFGLRRVFNGQPRSQHKGLDLRGAAGTPVLAMADGTVALAEELYFSGNVVYLDHGLGVFSLYAHLSAIDVRPGQQVSGGQTLGRVGSTGRVTGPHLHLGCYALGMAVDPVPLMQAEKQP
jgi:murein DD-endopeptidase MepM/ murein hydrolase activator NlpD